jgi:hypothetical protein
LICTAWHRRLIAGERCNRATFFKLAGTIDLTGSVWIVPVRLACLDLLEANSNFEGITGDGR